METKRRSNPSQLGRRQIPCVLALLPAGRHIRKAKRGRWRSRNCRHEQKICNCSRSNFNQKQTGFKDREMGNGTDHAITLANERSIRRRCTPYPTGSEGTNSMLGCRLQ